MNYTYEDFVEELRQALLIATGYEESRIYFKESQDYPQTSDDQIFIEFAKTGGTREVCGLYVRELYNDFRTGTKISEIVQLAMKELGKIDMAGIKDMAEKFSDYEKSKGNLFIRPLNFEKNKEDLKSCVYRVIGDIALVLYVQAGAWEKGVSSFKLRRDMVERDWGKNCDEVFDNALLNTSVLFPPRFYPMTALIFHPNYSGENFMDGRCDFPILKDGTVNCLSNSKRLNGAVSIFLPGVAARIGELMGSGFYMAFTSIHEVMIHSDQSVKENVGSIRDRLEHTVKKGTTEEDFLTMKIYHYDKESGEFSWE